MASSSKFIEIPQHCQLRNIINSMNNLQNTLNQALVAVAEYANDANHNTFIADETLAMRNVLNSEVTEMTKKLYINLKQQSSYHFRQQSLLFENDRIKRELSQYTSEITETACSNKRSHTNIIDTTHELLEASTIIDTSDGGKEAAKATTEMDDKIDNEIAIKETHDVDSKMDYC